MKINFTLLIFIVVLVMAGCQSKPKMNIEEKEQPSVEVDQKTDDKKEQKVVIDLINQEGIAIGIATLFEGEKGVHIQVDAHHLPAGTHGFHIHENGICETPSFESAGGHFNPGEKNHGFDDPNGFHNGDMENLEVTMDGTVEQQYINEAVTLEKGKKNSLLGKKGTAIIIHADPDDYVSQPTGNAGERIACGVINNERE